jgi:hypothetical protein
MNFFGPNKHDIENMARSFANYYYKNIIHNGWSHIVNVYDPNCVCSINGCNSSPNGLPALFASNNVHRACVREPSLTWKLVGDSLIITITSKMTFLNVAGANVKTAYTSDHFIVSYSRRKVVDHTMHIRTDILRNASFFV